MSFIVCVRIQKSIEPPTQKTEKFFQDVQTEFSTSLMVQFYETDEPPKSFSPYTFCFTILPKYEVIHSLGSTDQWMTY